jgi:hypothetical protein
MPDIEERLRTALDTVASEVAPTTDARADLERRLDRRRRIRRIGAASTAASVVAIVLGVFVPVVASQDVAPVTTAPPTAARGTQHELGTLVQDGESLRAVGYLRGAEYCTTLLPRGERTGRPTCEPVPTWPQGPADSLVQSRELLNSDPADDTGMLANRLVFLTDPRVTTLTVRRGDGSVVAVTRFARNEHAAAFLADFAGSPDGFGYTARDAAGKIVEEALT